MVLTLLHALLCPCGCRRAFAHVTVCKCDFVGSAMALAAGK